MVTIKEIAHKAQVSYATVSRAINGKPGVGTKTRSRILKLAGQMGYTHNWQARALVTGKVPLLGLVIPDITNPFFPEMIKGAEEEVYHRGYNLLLLNTDWKVDRLRNAFKLLSTRRVSGLMVAAPLDGMVEDLSERWERLAEKVVLAGVPSPEGAGLCAVEVDDEEGGRLVGRHLLERGFHRIAAICGPGDERSTRNRMSGLRKALQEAQKLDRLVSVSFGGWTVGSGRMMAEKLFAQGLFDRPISIFAANDLLALGVMQVIREHGLEVGSRAAVIGYDDIDWARYLEVPLTTVAQPKHEMGRMAAGNLIDLTEGRATRPQNRLRPVLVIRRSCGSKGPITQDHNTLEPALENNRQLTET